MADRLVVRGAREHNLKGVDIDLPVETIYQAIGQALHTTTATRQSRKGLISSWKAYAPSPRMARSPASSTSGIPAEMHTPLKEAPAARAFGTMRAWPNCRFHR